MAGYVDPDVDDGVPGSRRLKVGHATVSKVGNG